EVPVPHPVVDRLEMPDALAGLRVEAQQALRKEVAARPGAPVIVVVGRLDRRVDVSELLISAHLSPDADVTRVRPRVVQPGIAAELARSRDRSEFPQELPGADVVPSDVSLVPALSSGILAGRAAQSADDHHVADDERRTAPPVARRLVIVALRQIDVAGGRVAEAGIALSGLRVERDQV